MMQNVIAKVALQSFMMGGSVLSSYVMRTFWWQDGANTIFKDTALLRYNISLCNTLTGIQQLDDEENFMTLINSIDELLVHSSNPNLIGKKILVHRLVNDILNHVRAMCDAKKRTRDQESLAMCVIVEKDYFPELQSQLETIIYNLLLEN
jgi:hypothetical protein